MAGAQENLEDTMGQNEKINTIVNSEVYQKLIIQKRRFFVRVIVFFICFYFALPIGIILFPNTMSIVVFHHLTICWVFALLQFIMIWVIGGIYFFKAKQFDRLAEKLAAWGG